MLSVLDREDMQGLIARGYREHVASTFLLFRFRPNSIVEAKRWLASLPVKNSASARSDAHVNGDDTYINIAFSYGGLQRLGCPAAILSGFSDEFCAGMTAPHRSRILGDEGDNAPDKWQWGSEKQPVDGVLLVYARTHATLRTRYSSLSANFDSCGIDVVKKIDTCRLPHDKEHFGFHDAIANPIIEGLGGRSTATSMPPVKAGEFILGYKNEYLHYTARPVVDRTLDPHHILKDDVEGSGGADFGRNGSYLVFRQLRQNVYGFWSFIDQTIGKLPKLPAQNPRLWLGAKMVGRWQSGAPTVLTPDYDDHGLAKADDFLYRDSDPDGIACPISAHIRRVNPRDGFMLVNASRSIALSNRHRLLRRGRSYGPALTKSMLPQDMLAHGPDDVDRGLCFICLTANISRQFEFVQGSWINDPSFNTLHDDVDPLLGKRGRFTSADGQQSTEGTFTIPASPVRLRVHGLINFITMRGGAYFFAPGKAALRYLVQC